MKTSSLSTILKTLLCLAAVTVLVLPTQAKDSERHPIKLLKARMQASGRGSMGASKGNVTVWLQNVAGVTVDGVKVEVELYNDNRRLLDTLEKDVGEMTAGKKKVLTFKWDVISDDRIKPRIFVSYNAGRKKPVRFEGDTPTW